MAKVKDAEVSEVVEEKNTIDIKETLMNLKQQVDEFAKQEEIAKAMKNKALGAIEALTAVSDSQEEEK